MGPFISYIDRIAAILLSLRGKAHKEFWMVLCCVCTMFLYCHPGYAAQVTLAWDENTEPDIAGYKIYYGTASRMYNWFLDVGNVTRYTITDIPDGGTLYFAATAYNVSGIESGYSSEAYWSDINVNLPLSDITTGSQYRITGSGFGGKKGKLLVGNLPMKINYWSIDTIIFTASKVPVPAGPYDVMIKPKPYTTTGPLLLPGAIMVVNPQIGSISTDRGSAGDQIIITGMFFGAGRGKVFLWDSSNKKKRRCKVTDWRMDPTSGESTLAFSVPTLRKGFGSSSYTLEITNGVGKAQTPFTVEP